MEVGADEGQQRDSTAVNQPMDQPAAEQNQPAAEQGAPSPGLTVTDDVYGGTTLNLDQIHSDLQHGIVMDYWLLGALMFIAGILTVIAFVTTRGESHG